MPSHTPANRRVPAPPPSSRPRRRAGGGFTLLEAVILMTVLGFIALGVGVGLQALAKVPNVNDQQRQINAALCDKMETLRATGFTALTSGSDTVTIGKLTYTRAWTVATVPADGGSTAASDFKQIDVRIYLSGQAAPATPNLTTYLCQ